jgi:hypothetical protein
LLFIGSYSGSFVANQVVFYPALADMKAKWERKER